MLTEKEMAMLYETLLHSPGMNDTVKISLGITRKNALILAHVIELGIDGQKGKEGDLLVGNEDVDILAGIMDEVLAKAGLRETNERLKGLRSKT